MAFPRHHRRHRPRPPPWYPDAHLDLPGPCRVAVGRVSVASGLGFNFGRTLCPPPSAVSPAATVPTLFVLGDSHAGAYTNLITRFVWHTGSRARLYIRGGCALLGTKPEDETSCAVFNQAALADITRSARSNDILFLPALRIPRIADQFVFYGGYRHRPKRRPRPPSLAHPQHGGRHRQAPPPHHTGPARHSQDAKTGISFSHLPLRRLVQPHKPHLRRRPHPSPCHPRSPGRPRPAAIPCLIHPTSRHPVLEPHPRPLSQQNMQRLRTRRHPALLRRPPVYYPEWPFALRNRRPNQNHRRIGASEIVPRAFCVTNED